EPGSRQQADQRRIRSGQQRVGRTKPCGGQNKAVDLVARIDVRDTASLPIAEVVRRWQLVPEVFHAKVLSETTDGPVARVPLRNRFRLAGPIYGCCCTDMH